MELKDVVVGEKYVLVGDQADLLCASGFFIGQICVVRRTNCSGRCHIEITGENEEYVGYVGAENLSPVASHIHQLCCDGSSGNLDLEEAMADVMVKVFETFKKKQASYGSGNISSFGEFGVLVRMNDKMERLKNLVAKNKDNPLQDETIDDTYLDLADYALIAVLVRHGLWS
jgi:hypothetical protein